LREKAGRQGNLDRIKMIGRIGKRQGIFDRRNMKIMRGSETEF